MLAIYFSFISSANPIAYLRIDLGSLVLILGLAASALAGAAFALWRAWEQRRQKLVAAAADERRRFLRRLDHELKNPLTAIRAGLANLAESPSEPARREALVSVEAQALRLSRLAADLRKLAELEIRLVEHSPVDIPALLQEVYRPGPGSTRSCRTAPGSEHSPGSLAPAESRRRPGSALPGGPQSA